MKVLIIRMSSLGDILQCMSTVSTIKAKYPEAEVHWLVKDDFSGCLKPLKSLSKIWNFDKSTGLIGFVKYCLALRTQNFTHIYDAHNNVRSHIASWILCCCRSSQFIRRSKQRWKRFLLFYLGINRFSQPYRASESFISPLQKWGITKSTTPAPHLKFSNSSKLLPQQKEIYNQVVIAPSAAWELKRWPVEHWHELLVSNPNFSFAILGGPQDQFCQTLANIDPQRINNWAGHLSWEETFEFISLCRLVISGDTGVLHMADFLKKPTIALIGPTAFGYPSAPTSQVLEVHLPCRPCTKDGRGKCKNSQFKKCLIDISPQQVSQLMKEMVSPHGQPTH